MAALGATRSDLGKPRTGVNAGNLEKSSYSCPFFRVRYFFLDNPTARHLYRTAVIQEPFPRSTVDAPETVVGPFCFAALREPGWSRGRRAASNAPRKSQHVNRFTWVTL